MSFKSPNYTQVPNDFFDMIPDMSESELRATLALIRQTFGFHREHVKMSIQELMEATGMSDQGVRNGTTAAETRGTFERANPGTQNKAEWNLIVADPNDVDPNLVDVDPNLVDHRPQPSWPQGRVLKKVLNKDIKKKPDLVDLALEIKEKEDGDKEATKKFEQAFGFGSLPWHSGSAWDKFRRFVVAEHKKNNTAFGEYVVWRGTDGKYQAMSNKQIRMNPQQFIDTGWPEFEAAKTAVNTHPFLEGL